MDILTIVLGLAGATAATFAARRIAARLGRSPAAAFGLSAFFLSGLLYVAALQTLMLYGLPSGMLPVARAPEATFLAYAVLAAVFSIAAGVGMVAGWIAVFRNRKDAPNRLKTLGLASLFSLAVTILAAPYLIQNQLTIGRAIGANEAEISAFTSSYKSGLQRLAKVGALSRIEIDDAAITHYIGGPLYDVGPEGLAKYARAAMVYQTLVLGEAPKPVVLRDAVTEDRIGTFQPDGVFVVQTNRDLTQVSK